MVRSYDYIDTGKVKYKDVEKFMGLLVTSWGKRISTPRLHSLKQELPMWQSLLVHEHLLSCLATQILEEISVDAGYCSRSHGTQVHLGALDRIATKAKAESTHIRFHLQVQRLHYILNVKLGMDCLTLRRIFLQVVNAQDLHMELYGLFSAFATDPEPEPNAAAFLHQVHSSRFGELGVLDWLFTLLSPSEFEGGRSQVPLKELRSLKIVFEIDPYDPENYPFHKLEEYIRAGLAFLFEVRAKLGAVQLRLQGPITYKAYNVKFMRSRSILARVEFHAKAGRQSSRTDPAAFLQLLQSNGAHLSRSLRQFWWSQYNSTSE
jgi:hypothetical protein